MIAQTERLTLHRPTEADAAGLHKICSDPRVWTHFPSLCFTNIQQTETMLARWIEGWERDGLGTWIVRGADSEEILGYGGCSVRQGAFWNLGYRFAFEAQGNGLATEISLEALEHARLIQPELPVVAYLLEHNGASARVAEKVGLSLVYRGADAGNPDPDAVRLVYADRPLTDVELAATLH